MTCCGDVFDFSELQEFKGDVCRILWLQKSLWSHKTRNVLLKAGWECIWDLKANPSQESPQQSGWEHSPGQIQSLGRGIPWARLPLPPSPHCPLWTCAGVWGRFMILQKTWIPQWNCGRTHFSDLWSGSSVTWANEGKWVLLPVQSLSSPVYSSLFTITYFPECFAKVYNSGNTKLSKMHLPRSLCQHQGQATSPLLCSPFQ